VIKPDALSSGPKTQSTKTLYPGPWTLDPASWTLDPGPWSDAPARRFAQARGAASERRAPSESGEEQKSEPKNLAPPFFTHLRSGARGSDPHLLGTDAAPHPSRGRSPPCLRVCPRCESEGRSCVRGLVVLGCVCATQKINKMQKFFFNFFEIGTARQRHLLSTWQRVYSRVLSSTPTPRCVALDAFGTAHPHTALVAWPLPHPHAETGGVSSP
jgi:hypothetical protein